MEQKFYNGTLCVLLVVGWMVIHHLGDQNVTLAIISVAFPFVLVLAGLIWPQNISILRPPYRPKGSDITLDTPYGARLQLALPWMFITLISLGLDSYYYVDKYTCNWHFMWLLPFGVGIAISRVLSSREISVVRGVIPKSHIVLFALIFGIPLNTLNGIFALKMADIYGDHSLSHSYKVQVIDKTKTLYKGRFTYSVRLDAWGDFGSPYSLDVDADLYNSVEKGGQVCLTRYDGRFNIAWYQFNRCAAF